MIRTPPTPNIRFYMVYMLVCVHRSAQMSWRACKMVALAMLKRQQRRVTGRNATSCTLTHWPSCHLATKRTPRLRSTATSPRKPRSWPMICEEGEAAEVGEGVFCSREWRELIAVDKRSPLVHAPRALSLSLSPPSPCHLCLQSLETPTAGLMIID